MKTIKQTFFILSFLLISLTAYSQGTDLAIAINGSGSISAADFELQKNGIRQILSNIERDGTNAFVLVQYAGSSTTLHIPYTIVTSFNIGDLNDIVDNLNQRGGGTNPGDGVNRVMQEFLANGNPSNTQVLCLSTDGDPNRGADIGGALMNAQSSAIGLDRFSVIGIADPEENFFEQEFFNAYGGLNFGGGLVTFTSGSIEYANLLGGACLEANVELLALEVTQVVQDWNNSVSLIEDKPTLVRAFIQSKNTSSPIVDARLRGFDANGNPLTPRWQVAENKPFTAPPSNINNMGPLPTINNMELRRRRKVKDESLNFRLPATWLKGTITLKLEGLGSAIDCTESYQIDDDCSISTPIEFEKVNDIEVRFVSITHTKTDGTIATPTPTDIDVLADRLLSIYPISGINKTELMIDYSDYTDDGVIDRRADSQNIKDILNLIWFISTLINGFNNELYYGVVVDAVGASGLPKEDRLPGGSALDIPGNVSWGSLPSNEASYGRNRHAHEIAHSLGLNHVGLGNKQGKHADCNSWSKNPLPLPHIYTDPATSELIAGIGPLTNYETLPFIFSNRQVHNEIYGFDFNQDKIVDPYSNFELMSYCSGWRWISDFTYEKIKNKLIDKYGPNSNNLRLEKVNEIDFQDYLLISGVVDSISNTADFNPFYLIPTAFEPEASLPGNYSLELLDGNNQIIQTISFEPIFFEDADENNGFGLFSIPILFNPDIKIIKVYRNETFLNQIQASSNSPEVEVVFPNGGESLNEDIINIQWIGSDLDQDQLSYVIQYSPDGGTTWETLAVNFSETNFEIPINQLDQSNQGVIRIISSDGYNSTYDVSDGFFITPNNAPTVSIQNPTDGSEYVGVEPIFFDGSASDLDEGSLTGNSLSWSSDIDGFLGNGETFNLIGTDLSEGTHTITLTATDELGATATTSVTINISFFSNILPLVDIISPTENSTFDNVSSVFVEISAQDLDVDDSITNVILVLNSDTIDTLIDAPYTYDLPITESGTYQLEVFASDSRGGVGSDVVTFVVGGTDSGCDIEVLEITTSDFLSCGETDGFISISAQSSNNLEYSIDGGNTYQSSNNFDNLIAGQYEVIIQDADNECSIEAGTVELDEPAGCVLCNDNFVSINVTDIKNCGMDNGSIRVVATILGTEEYSIDGGLSFQNSSTFTNIAIGAYSIVVRNTEGTCLLDPQEVVVGEPEICSNCNTETLNIGITDVSVCNGKDGKITITPNVDFTFAYSIDGGSNFISSGNFVNLNAGVYNVVVKTLNGNCIIEGATATIEEPAGCEDCSTENISVNVTPLTTCNSTDGIIDISVNIAGNIEYSIDGGNTYQTDNSFNNLEEGVYDVSVQSSDKVCLLDGLSAIVSPPSGCEDCNNDAVSIAISNVSSCDNNNGSIEIMASFGGTYEFSIDGGLIYQSSNTFNNLSGGSYNIIVRNTEGVCTINVGAAEINSPMPIIENSQVMNITNCNNTDGVVIVNAQSEAAIQFSIDNGLSWQNSGVFSGLSAGTYTVLVQYTDGTCTVQSDELIVNPPTDFTSEAIIITCPSTSIVNLCAPVSAPAALGLQDFGLSTCVSSADYQFEVEETMITDGLSVSYVQSYTITEPNGDVTNCELIYNTTTEFLQAPLLAQPSPICVGDLLSGVKIEAGSYNFYSDNNGKPGELISICDYGGTICSTESFMINTNESGLYTIWVTEFARNGYGVPCESAAVPLVFEVMPLPQASLIANEAKVCLGETLMLSDYVETSDQGGFWSGDGVMSIMDNNGEMSFIFNGMGLEYQSPVKLYYTKSNSMCENSNMLMVEVDETPSQFWNVPDPLCYGLAQLDLTTFLSEGIQGEWTGFGVSSNGMFNAASGPGSYTISFLSNDPQACNNVQTHTIIVNDAPDASFELKRNICTDDEAIVLLDLLTGDAGGTFTGEGVINNMFFPDLIEGSSTITYTVTQGDCTSEFIMIISVTRVQPPVASIVDPICTDATVLELMVENNYPFIYNWYLEDGVTLLGTGSEIELPISDEGQHIFLVEAESPDGCKSELINVPVDIIDCNICSTIYSFEMSSNLACSEDIVEFEITLDDSSANNQIVKLETSNGRIVNFTPIGNGQYYTSLVLSNGYCNPDEQSFTITAYCSDGVTIADELSEEIVVYPKTIQPFVSVSISEDGCTATAYVLPECTPYIFPVGDWTSTIEPGDKNNSEFNYVYSSDEVDVIGCFEQEGSVFFGHNCIELLSKQNTDIASIRKDSIHEENELNVDIYPNPTTGKFVTNLTERGLLPTSLKIFNTQGKVIASKIRNNFDQLMIQFNLSEESAGIYLIQIKFIDGSCQNLKLIKE